MKKVILSLTLTFVSSGLCMAQIVDSQSSSTTSSKTSVSKNGGDLVLQSGTQVAAQLQNSLDVKQARVGDQVILKTTQSIKQNGRVVVDKGSLLVGRVTEVQQKVKANATSKIGILFDRLENGRMIMPIEATVSSITQAQSKTNVNDAIDSDIAAGSSVGGSTQSQNSNGGGLLGGVTNTVGGVVNATTQTVAGATSTVGQTVGSTVRGIRITQSASASAEGSSTLSLTGENLRLEKGTTFNLRLNESVSKKGN